MTIVLNKCFGGFHIPEAFAIAHGIGEYDDIDRSDPELIEFVRSHGNDFKERCARLKAVDIPDDCTDWEMDEYDGVESITYVVDGRLYHA